MCINRGIKENLSTITLVLGISVFLLLAGVGILTNVATDHWDEVELVENVNFKISNVDMSGVKILKFYE
jgi:hypothetical protein